jgi:uncharacterized membrane protein YhaH (DUF805 family)
MDFWTAVQTCFRQYATFAGRARRSEFWYFVLFLILGAIVAAILDAALGAEDAVGSGTLGLVFNLATLLPTVAATARRLHDTGRSGWWQAAVIPPSILLGFGLGSESQALAALGGLATIGLGLLILVWLILRGTQGPNRFGPDPLGPPVMAQPYGAPPPGGNPWR